MTNEYIPQLAAYKIANSVFNNGDYPKDYSAPVISITENNITLLYPQLSPAEVYSVKRNDPNKAAPLLDVIKSKDADLLHYYVETHLARKQGMTELTLDTGWAEVDGGITFRGEPVGPVMQRRVTEARELGLPLEPFEKFLIKLDQNPSYNSRQQLLGFLNACDLPITDTGDFIAYKAVRDDFFDKHTGTVEYAIGSVVEMPRSEVDDNPEHTCSKGLHVCSKGYGRYAERLLIVYVNPADVVSVPTDYNNAKMRVCRLTVGEEIKDFKEFVDEPIYNSHYDAESYDYDYDEWDELCEEGGDDFYDNDWISFEDEDDDTNVPF